MISNKARIAIFIILLLGAIIFLTPSIYASGRLAFDAEFIHVFNTEAFGMMYLISYIFWGCTVYASIIIYGIQKYRITKKSGWIILIVILNFVLIYPIGGIALLSANAGWIQMMISSLTLFVISIGIGLYILLSKKQIQKLKS